MHTHRRERVLSPEYSWNTGARECACRSSTRVERRSTASTCCTGPRGDEVRLFQLEQGFVWIDPRDGSRTDIPAHDLSRPASDPHNSTDLASVPPFLWGLVASYGHQTLPAILHDALSDRADEAPPARQLAVRRAADGAFRIALREAGVTTLRSTTMWAVVSMQRYLRFRPTLGGSPRRPGRARGARRRRRGRPGGPRPSLVAARSRLAPAVLALGWGRDAPVVIAGSYLGALYSPLIVSAALSSAVEYVIAATVYLLGARSGPAPRPGPTVRSPDLPPGGQSSL